MRVFDLLDDQNRVFAFEVPNFGRHRLAKFLERTPGIKVLHKPRSFAFASQERFCEFEFEGQRFVVSEPFGDSSRFWVGTEPPSFCPQLAAIRNAFASGKAWWFF